MLNDAVNVRKWPARQLAWITTIRHACISNECPRVDRIISVPVDDGRRMLTAPGRQYRWIMYTPGTGRLHHTRLRPGYVMHWKSPMIMSDIHYNAQLLDGNAYMTSRQWIVSSRGIMGFTFLPACCSEEIRIPMGWTTASCPAGHWTYRRHTKRTGHSYYIHTRGWFENLPRPGERWLDSGTVDSEVIVCEYSRISSGLCCQWLWLNPISDCIYLRQCISYVHTFCHSMQSRWPHWRHGPYLITILCEELILPRMPISLNRTFNVFSVCCATWTPVVCYQCSKVDQTPHGFPNKSFPDTWLAGGMSHCVNRNIQPPVPQWYGR